MDPDAAPLVDAVIEDPRWETLDVGALAERAARAALAAAGGDLDGSEIGLLAADDARVATLNAAFRGKHAPTNVLSWPASGPAAPGEARFLGNLALAWDTCMREAAAAGIAPADHVTHLVVHGVLHLVGRDHAGDAEAAAMEALEAKILASLGVANPYRSRSAPGASHTDLPDGRDRQRSRRAWRTRL
ncbi:MAG: rRNA maturation RNase YbeY [Rhodobacteraceae bacterium]|nr:rRNA maturation RNase YbeY [Paracoccaceae bacterium]